MFVRFFPPMTMTWVNDLSEKANKMQASQTKEVWGKKEKVFKKPEGFAAWAGIPYQCYGQHAHEIWRSIDVEMSPRPRQHHHFSTLKQFSRPHRKRDELKSLCPEPSVAQQGVWSRWAGQRWTTLPLPSATSLSAALHSHFLQHTELQDISITLFILLAAHPSPVSKDSTRRCISEEMPRFDLSHVRFMRPGLPGTFAVSNVKPDQVATKRSSVPAWRLLVFFI